MAIWDICIRRPVFTCMLVAAPIVLGLASYNRLGVELFPNVDLPLVVVTTTLRGASVEEMETSVTKPIEEITNTISGIDELRSTTKEGFSQLVIGFVLEKNGDVAAQEVRDKVAGIMARLPAGTDPPIIEKFDLEAAPVLTIAVSGKRSIQEVTEIARKRLKEDLETVHGVGAVVLVGGRTRAVNVVIDTDKLTSYDLSIEDVRQALVRQNLELPGGRVEQGSRELVLRTMGRVEKAADFADLIIADRNKYPVRISDVGRVDDSVEEPRGLSRLDGENAVSIIVQKQSGTNTVAVVDAIKQRLAQITPDLPADIKTVIIRDQSRFIKNSIDEVKVHLLLAALLVGGTIFLFIRDWRTTLIASLAIPCSIVATFAFMDAMGLTLNNITMLALILAVGIVIDDAVVVHENVFRHMEEHGRSAREAASSATREIALAVIATTLSLLVIFIPIAFMSGRVGRFFNCFGYTVGFAILISMLVSFTLTPMMCGLFLKRRPGHQSKGPVWRLVSGSYGRALRWSLRHRWVVVLLTFGLFLATPVLFLAVGKDFVPRDDQSEYEIDIRLPEGYSLERADELLRHIEGRLRELRGTQHVFTIIGDETGKAARGQGEVTHANVYVRIPELNERPYSQFDLQRDARALMAEYPDLRTTVQDIKPYASSGFREVQVDLNLRGPDLDKLQGYADELTAWMKSTGRYVDVDTSLSLRKPELRIRIHREKASDLGVSVQSVATAMNVLVGGEPVSKYKELDEQYDVWLRAESHNRSDAAAIGSLMVPSERAGLQRVENFTSIEPAKGPSTIERYGRQRQVVVSANLEGMVVGDAVQELTEKVKSLNMPPEYRFEFLGQAKLMAESNSNFAIAFALAFLFMYMILAAQFESLAHPITILAAIPLTLPFALLSLIALRTALDLYAILGLFMLFGIVKKNGILQVDYTNVLRAKGLPRNQAILEANDTRLRPILMTTVMLVAAMVPIALGTGPGAGARANMAKVILGGQLLSLLLTLLVTPVAYSIWDDLGNWSRRMRGKLFGPKAEPAKATEPMTVAPPEPVGGS